MMGDLPTWLRRVPGWAGTRYQNTEVKKYKNTEIQKYRNTEIQKYSIMGDAVTYPPG